MSESISSVQTGIIAIERDPSLVKLLGEGHVARPPSWRPAVGGTALEVLGRYRGVDGISWPEDVAPFGIILIDGIAPLIQVRACRRYQQGIAERHTVDLFAVGSHTELENSNVAFRGFDIGWISDDLGNFSALLHECLFGQHQELREFAGVLNQNLLFSRMEIAEQFLEVRSRLVLEGTDLETYGTARAVAVYEPPPEVPLILPSGTS